MIVIIPDMGNAEYADRGTDGKNIYFYVTCQVSSVTCHQHIVFCIDWIGLGAESVKILGSGGPPGKPGTRDAGSLSTSTSAINTIFTKIFFFEKCFHAHFCSYATLVSFVGVVEGYLFQILCKYILTVLLHSVIMRLSIYLPGWDSSENSFARYLKKLSPKNSYQA